MVMRHSWTIKIKAMVKVSKVQEILGSGYVNKIYRLKDVKECKYCGLMKGMQTGGKYLKWHNLIYFKDGKFLSEERLPYECIGPDNGFLTKEDFYV
jgi:hypothetical protein